MEGKKETFFEQQLAKITARETAAGSEFIFKAAHKPAFTRVKGKYRVTCVCGWVVAGKFATQAEAEARYALHTGVIEKQVRR